LEKMPKLIIGLVCIKLNVLDKEMNDLFITHNYL
jgi:hypothetical protein